MKHTLTILLVFAAVCQSMAQLNGPPIVNLTLEDAVQLSLENGHEAKQAQQELIRGDKRAMNVVAQGMPDIKASADYNYNFDIQSTAISFGGQEIVAELGVPQTMSFVVELYQPIIDARYFIGLPARKAILEATKLQFYLTEVRIKEATTKAYFNGLAAKERIRLLKSNLTNIEKTLQETKARYENGFVEELDVDQLELSLANLKTNIRASEMAYKYALANIQYLCGADQSAQLSLTDDLYDLIDVHERSNIAKDSFSVQNRIEFSLLSSQVSLRDYDVRQQRANYYPSVSAFANYGLYGFETDQQLTFEVADQLNTAGSVGLSIDVPIFSGLRKSSTIAQSKVDLEKTRNDLNNFLRYAPVETQLARNEYVKMVDQFHDMEKNLELAEKIHQKQQLKYKEGVGSSTDLTKAEKDLVETQLNYVNTALRMLISKIDLEIALGHF